MTLAVALALMVLASRDGAGEKINCAQGFDALREEAAALPGVNRTSKGGFDIYDALDKTGYVYMLTTADDPAHPSVIRRRVFTQDDNVMSKLEACGYGSRPPFDRLMGAFEAREAEIRKKFSGQAKE